jgi:hypothetical protein
MTHTADTTGTFAAIRARNELARKLRGHLKGHRLDAREQGNDLVISRPGHAEKGRYHVNLASGDVTHRITIWDYCGHLAEHGPGHDPGDCITLATIIANLTAPDTPAMVPRNGDPP